MGSRTDWEDQQRTLAARVVASNAPDFYDNVHLIAGLDISYFTDRNGQNERAIACASVIRYPSLERIATEIIDTTVQEPYEPGFLAFREIEPYSQLVQRLGAAGVRPDVFMVDGFGVLHPRGCGSASHLGVREDLVTIGVAKHLLTVEPGFITERQVRERIASHSSASSPVPENPSPSTSTPTDQPDVYPSPSDIIHYPSAPGARGLPLRSSRGILGVALAPPSVERPVYVSVGHRIGLDASVRLTLGCCRYKNPEPLRLADLEGRAYIRERYGRMENGRLVE